ncbi:MAG: EamA family transporter, partial [Pseudomonadota bacterium]
LAAGNWKMNGTTASLAELSALMAAHPAPGVDVLICPPAPLIAAIRYWAFGAFVLLWAARRPGGLRAAAATTQPLLQMARGALLGLQIIVAITAFARVGLVNTLALFAAAPLAVAALSAPVLGEPVGWRRWTAIGVGCVGVLIILRPGPDLLDRPIWIAVVAVIGIAVYSVMTRLAARRDDARTSFFYTGIGGMAVLSLIGPFFWTPLSPPDWGWMAVLCVSGAAGHYFLIRAFEEVAAVVIQPVMYLQTVIGAAVGATVFGEALEAPVILGAAIVIAAGLFTAWREAVRARDG